MAISASLLTSLDDGSESTSYATSSVTPTGDTTVFAMVLAQKASGEPPVPTVSGNGLTWTQRGASSYYDDAGQTSKLMLFSASGSSPSSGAVTASFSSTLDCCSICVFEVSGTDTTTTDGVVTTNTDTDTQAAADGTSASFALSAFGSAVNGVVAVWGANTTDDPATDTWTVPTDHIEIDQSDLEWDIWAASYKATEDTAGTGSFSGVDKKRGCIAVEVKSASQSATPTPNDLIGSATFDSVTLSAGATPTPTDLIGSATFDAVTLTYGAGSQPSVLDVFAGFPTATGVATQNATPTPADLEGAVTFPAVTTVAINGEVVNPAALEVGNQFGTPIATGVINSDAAPNTLAADMTFSAVNATGQESDQTTLTAIPGVVTFPTAGTNVTNNEDVTATALHGSATFPYVDAEARDLDHFYNADVGLAVEIAFDDYPLVGSPTWTNITSDVRSFTISRGRQSELDEYKAGVATILVDANQGDYDPANDGGAYYPNVIPMKQLRIRASYGGTTYTIYRGFIEHWPMQIRGYVDETVTLKAVDGLKLLNAAKDSSANSQENSATRVGNLLDHAGWPAALRTLGSGVVTVPAYTPDCQTTLALIRQIKDSEGGQFYIDREGKATFRNRTYRSGLSSVATFGPSDIPYQDIALDYDDSQIWNRVEVLIGGFPSYSSSTASQDKYGIRQLTVNDILLPNSTDGNDLADIYVNRYKDPRERIESITLKPEASPTVMWPQVLGRNLSDKVTVNYDGAGGLRTMPSYIEAVTHKVSRGRPWTTTWQLSQFQ